MPIQFDVFKENVKPGGFHKVGLHAIPLVHQRAVKYFCTPLIARSACSTECQACIQAVRERLNTAAWDPAQSPYGLYTYILKQAAAAAMEHASVIAKTPIVFNPLVEEKDALDLFMETLA